MNWYTCNVADPGSARAYYEANTGAFLRWGQGGSAGVIHRAVWAPGVHTRAQAFAWAHRRAWLEVAAHAGHRSKSEAGPRVLDLGCGVGAGVLALLEWGADSAVGVTISEVQVERARRAAKRAARFVCADFCDLPPLGGPFDLAFAIEAFVHALDPARFFSQAASQLRAGGRLVVIDDVRSDPRAGARERVLLERFVHGWRVPSLSTRAQICGWASDAGLALRSDERLTAMLELGRPRDRAIAAIVRRGAVVGRRLPGARAQAWWGNLQGGDALQTCLREGLIDYRCMVFERAGDHVDP